MNKHFRNWLIFLIVMTALSFIWGSSSHAKDTTIYAENYTSEFTNKNMTITPTGTGTVELQGDTNVTGNASAVDISASGNLDVTGTTTLDTALTGVVKAASGVISAGDVDLTSEVGATVLPVANGGTGSSTALNNNFVMISSGGQIVEDSNVSTTELGYLDGATSNVQTQMDAKAPLVLTTQGDILYHDGAGYQRLAIGTPGYVLKVNPGGTSVEWAVDSATGAITSGGSSTDNAVPRWDGAAGDTLQDSGVIIDDSDNMSGVGSLSINGLASQTGLGNSTYFGELAGANDDLSANNNVGVGYHALTANTTGQGNTAVGYRAADSMTTGIWNTAIGFDALMAASTTNNNTAIGSGTLRANFGSAGQNTAVGADAMRVSSTAQYNTAIGYASFRQSASYLRNVGLGVETGYNVAGNENVLVGYQAGMGVGGAAANNVFIGAFAGDSVSTGTGNILIGHDVDLPSASTNDHMNIGDTLYGDLANNRIGVNVPSPTVDLDVLGDSLFTGNINVVGDVDVDNVNIDGNTISITDTNGSMFLTPDGTGRVSVSSELHVQGPITTEIVTDSTSTGANVTLVDPVDDVLRLTNVSLTSIDMIVAPIRSKKLVLINHTGSTIALNDTTGATPANQIMTGIGSNLSLADQASVNLQYDLIEQKWMVIGGSGGGGGGSLQNAYDASADGEIVLDASQGSFQVQDASTPLGAPLLEVLSNDGLTSYFDVQVSGTTIDTQLDVDNINLNGNTISSTDVNGNITLAPNGTGRVQSSGEIESQSVISESLATDAATTGANASMSLPATGIIRLTNASLSSIDMIAAAARGQRLTLVNHTGSAISINDETGATPADRILTGTGAAISMEDQASINLVYDTTETRWLVIGGSGSGTVAADDVTYNNATSGLTATDVQAAIDEVEGRVDTAETNISGLGLQTAYDQSTPSTGNIFLDIDNTQGPLIFRNSSGDPVSGIIWQVRNSSDSPLLSVSQGLPAVSVNGRVDTTSINVGSSTEVSSVLDEDNMASDSATALATQQSIKAYTDTASAAAAAGVDLQDAYDQSTPSGGFVIVDLNDTQGPLVFRNDSGDAIGDPIVSFRDSSDVEKMYIYPDNATVLDVVGTISSDGLTVGGSGTLNLNGSTAVSSILDEDNMASDSATALATQQSIKAYVDAQIVPTRTNISAHTTGSTSITGGSFVDMSFSTEVRDDLSEWDGTTFTVTDTGYYKFTVIVDVEQFDADMDIGYDLNSGGYLSRCQKYDTDSHSADSGFRTNVCIFYLSLTASDTIEVGIQFNVNRDIADRYVIIERRP